MPSVLVVDDSAVDRRLVAGLLQHAVNWQVELAESAEQALQRLTAIPIDVVLTDLRMAGMDGLALLRAIRLQYADLPVVLMTAEGSEALAVEALRQGAAGYVPKSQLATLLVETLEHVLGVVRADRAHGDLVHCQVRNEFTFTLPNDATLIGPLVDLVQQMIASVGLCDATGRVRVAVALEQALLNALFRGNLELSPEELPRGDTSLIYERRHRQPYCNRKLHVDVAITHGEARFVVRDEGPGFDTKPFDNKPLDNKSLEAGPATLERESGRRIVLLQSFMDEVRFNEQGNEVTLVKRREAPLQAPSQEAAADRPLAATAGVQTAAAAKPSAPTRWGEVPTGSRVTDSISGRAYRVHRGSDVVTLSAPGGDTLMFGLDEGIDPARYRVYVL